MSMSSKFKEGDKVKLKKSSVYYIKSGEDNHNPIKTEGVVLKDPTPEYLRVEWANGNTNSYEDKDLKLVEKASEETVVAEAPVEPTFVVGNKYKVISGHDWEFHAFSLGEIVTCIKAYQAESTSGKTEGTIITKGDFKSVEHSVQILYPEHVEAVVEVKEEAIKPQTPFEREGYTEDMTFKVKQLGGFDFKVGDILTLKRDDRSYSPNFKRVMDGKTQYVCLSKIEVVKEKPKTKFEKKGWTKDTLFKVVDPSFSVAFTEGDIIKLAVDDGSEICEFERISDGLIKYVRFDDIDVYVAPAPAIENPWIEWKGGEMPVPKGTLVDVKHRDGGTYYNVEAGAESYAETWIYKLQGGPGNIIAYRLNANASVTSSEALQGTLEEKAGASITSEQSAVKGLVEPSKLKGEDLVVGESYIVTSEENWNFTLGDTVTYMGKDSAGDWRFQGTVDEVISHQIILGNHGSPYRVKRKEEFLIVGDKYKVIKTGCAGWFFNLGDIITFEGGGRFRGEKYPQYLSGDNLINIKDSVEKVEIPKVSFDEISEALRTAISGVLKDKLGDRIETAKVYDPLDVKVATDFGRFFRGCEPSVSVEEPVGIQTFYKLNIGNLDLNNLTHAQLYDIYEKIEEVL